MPYVITTLGIKKRYISLKTVNKSLLDVSVLVPTYREAGGILRLIQALRRALERTKYEIIIIDDDSRDGTAEIIDKEAKRRDVRAVHRYGVRGIFSAILDGAILATGKNIVIMDADFSHPPEKLVEMLKAKQDFDMVNCSRFKSGGGVSAPFIRKFSTIALNALIRIVLGLKQTDLTGGFHLLDKEKFRQLKFRYPSIWGEFDLELMWRANKAGWQIKEIPFKYNFRAEGQSKSAETLPKFIAYGARYFFRAVKLRLEG